jgi:hypothetical protein
MRKFFGAASSSLTNLGEENPQHIPTVSVRSRKKVQVPRAGGGTEDGAMYTGELIDNLVEQVESAELTAFVRVTEARKAKALAPACNTYIYEFVRNQPLSGIGVA